VLRLLVGRAEPLDHRAVPETTEAFGEIAAFFDQHLGGQAYRFAWPRARASVSSSAGTSSRGTTAWMMLSRSA
jgi:hypothetical protein